jgi:hypothetical protein
MYFLAFIINIIHPLEKQMLEFEYAWMYFLITFSYYRAEWFTSHV